MKQDDQWVSIDKKYLPPHGLDVLLRIHKHGNLRTKGAYALGYYNEITSSWFFMIATGTVENGSKNEENWQVTHWTLFPRPPKL